MGCGKKVVDALLFFFFLTFVLTTPILDADYILPKELIPKFVVDVKNFYINLVGDYLVVEKPHFFVGLTWFDILIVWPLSILNIYAILAGKSWFSTTSLIQGVGVFTSIIPILADIYLSGKGSVKMQLAYYPFLAFSILAILRGLLPCFGGTSAIATAIKKRV
ncbi:sigma intracellular receptor 2-like [Impatiens glandulifera]|uniref:sigma intracellular receptor 2-like n=1 Tax=Impatiens glandulifera TaxID=253017 RepID=UPI001FB0A659|nr:sigma intracellular receptor 2-like [Impatiens glandulifera]